MNPFLSAPAAGQTAVTPISSHLFTWTDTCNVYILRRGVSAVLVDFGDGSVLEALKDLGIARITDVLITHHHRDQCQGLRKAVERGARIWAPYTEQDLFGAVDEFWQSRQVMNNYRVRQDRFSLLEPVPAAGYLRDYDRLDLNGFPITVLPTPGHTPGSVSLLVEIDGRQVAFTGDLIAAPGKLWSLAATQWTYNGAEGVPASIASLAGLRKRQPDLLLPSHGRLIENPAAAIEELTGKLVDLLAYRNENPNLAAWLEKPYLELSPHLLHNRTGCSYSYVLLSESRKALVIDFGYDMMTGMAEETVRAARRPWLYTSDSLERDYGVKKIDVAIPTHYHDDHVAGMNLLRRVKGTQIWIPENFAPILRQPSRFNLPCLWFDSVPADRELALGHAFQWEEYLLQITDLPGHTQYEAGIFFEVDGLRVLAVGDLYQGEGGGQPNYVYENHFHPADFRRSAEIYRQLMPDLVLPGHWDPFRITPEYLDEMDRKAQVLERLHREIVSEEPTGISGDTHVMRLLPYQVSAHAGEAVDYQVEVTNPAAQPVAVEGTLVIPPGWSASPPVFSIVLEPGETCRVAVQVVPCTGLRARRVRLAVDLTLDGRRLGQQAEALLTLKTG